jgi:predicted metalloprotease with PDZ domain
VRVITRTQAQLFGGLPFRDYRFLYHVRDRWHGVEHEDSCSIILRRNALLGAGPGDEGYDHMLSITSHELFHAWNIKRMLPAKFSPYDYWNATPTRLLWAMEGLTSYYGELTLVRGGLWTVDRYLRHLGTEIQTLESLPARTHLSLAQASFDGWLSDPAQMHDYPNAWFSFYNKGEVVSALLDLTIRRQSNGERSLDDVVRLLWQEHDSNGLAEDAVERAVERVTDVGDFFIRYVDGTEPLPYEELLTAAGLTFAVAPREPESAALGVRVKIQDGLVVTESVVRGGAGMEAGLLPGDELLALGDTRITSEASLSAALRGLHVGQSTELLIARAGVVKRLSLAARPDPRPIITLRIESASELRRGWLGRDA